MRTSRLVTVGSGLALSGGSGIIRATWAALLIVAVMLAGPTRPAQAQTDRQLEGGRPEGVSGEAGLPADRDASANWRMAGMLSAGGIPDRTTVCATVSPLGRGQDD